MFRLMWVWMVGDGWTLSGYGLGGGQWMGCSVFGWWWLRERREKQKVRETERES